MARKEDPEKNKRILALVGAAALLAITLLMVTYGMELIVNPPQLPQIFPGASPPPSQGPQQATTAGQEYSESPLVELFSVSSTPKLVFNCVKSRTGTYANAEASGDLAEGTEKQDIINAVCDATTDPVLCANTLGTPVSVRVSETGQDYCISDDGRILVYALHSPQCGACRKQRPMLEELELEYGEVLDVHYVCVNLYEGDDELCKQKIISGEYDE